MGMMNNLVKNDTILFDDGFYFGRGVFETILLRNGKPILLSYHLKRMNEGLDILGIKKCITEEYVRDQIKDLKYNNVALKIMVSEKNTLFSIRDIPYNKEDYVKGFSVRVSNVLRNETSLNTYIKSFAYYDNIIEKGKAKELGFEETLFLNTKSFITECSTSNIFFINGDKICTPRIKCGILNGTVRRFLLENLNQHYNFEEGNYTIEDLYNAQGIFITNSLLGVMKVNKINEYKIGEHKYIFDIKEKYEKLIKEYT